MVLHRLCADVSFWKKKESINIRENQQLRTQNRADVDAPADFQIFMDDCSVLDSFDKRLILRTTPRVFDLPFKGSDGILRGSAMLSWITHFCGFIRITVRNRTSGVIDYAIYRISSDQAEPTTLASALSNDATQVVTTAPLSQCGNTPRFCYFFPVQADGVTLITGTNAGKGFMVDAYVGGNVSLIGSRMSDLSAAYAAGAKFRRVQVLAPVKAFATSMASLIYNAGGGLPFQCDNQIGIKNGAGASTVAAAKLLDNLRVSFVLSHFPDICA